MMEQIVQQFNEINQMFWNGSSFQWIFYISIILILIFEKDKIKKLVFGVFPLVVLVVIFNPATPIVLGAFFKGVDAYYVRLFSIIPVFYCITHSAVLLLNMMQGAYKALAVCAGSIIIILAGSSVFRESWLQRAFDIEKIPAETMAVLEAIPREEDNVCVAFPNPLNIYARQVDGSIKMPYGRFIGHSNELQDELNKTVPDARSIMEMAGNQSVDYVVVRKADEVEHDFAQAGYTSVGETRNYLIYPVLGVNHIERKYNDKGQVILTMNCDSENNVIKDINGYSGIRYEYDRWGNRIKETYVNENGKPFAIYTGVASRLIKYRLSGLVESVTFLGADDMPVLCSGISKITYAYDHERRVVRNKYYDENGNPVMYFGRYETRFTYNQSGQVIQESYYDENGELMDLSNSVFAVRNIEYNDKGEFIDETYSNSKGELVDITITDANNLIWNGDFRAEGTRWLKWGSPILCEIEKKDEINWLHVITTGVHWEGLSQPNSLRAGTSHIAELRKGVSYTLSFKGVAEKGKEGATFRFGVRNYSTNGEVLIDNCWTPDFTLEGEIRNYTYTFTPTVDGSFEVVLATDRVVDAYFTDVRLEQTVENDM